MTCPRIRARLQRLAALTAVAMLALAGELRAEPDTLIVEVRLERVGTIVVLGVQDGEDVRLPAAEVFELLGLSDPPAEYITPEELEDLLGIQVLWLPRRLQVVVRDPQRVLPATRERLDRLRAASRARQGVPAGLRRTGPFVAVTVDDRQESLVDVGYSLGRLVGRVAQSSISGASWSVSLSPVPRLWVSYRDSERRDPAVNLRTALGPLWLSADYRSEEVAVSGAAMLGRFVVFGSSRPQAVVTWRGPVHVQLGHTEERTAFRVTYGAIAPSGLSMPTVR